MTVEYIMAENLPKLGRMRARVQIATGATSAPVYCYGRDAMLVCKPGAGGTLKAQLSWSPQSIIEADFKNQATNAIWVDWAPGVVSVTTSGAVSTPTAVRFVAATQPGTGEVAL